MESSSIKCHCQIFMSTAWKKSKHIWNLERWHWWSYLHGSKGGTDIKNRLLITVEDGGSGKTWESDIKKIYITICKIDILWEFAVWFRKPKARAPWQPRGVGWWREMGKRFKREMTCIFLLLTHVNLWQKPSLFCKVTIL